MTVSTTTSQLQRVIQQALINESVADRRMAVELLTDADIDGLPPFKQLKLVVWQHRLGRWFQPSFVLAQVLLPVWLGFVWVRLLVRSLAPSRASATPPIVYFDFFESHVAQIIALPDGSGGTEVVAPLSAQQVAASLGFRSAVRSIKVHVRIVRWLLTTRNCPQTPHLLYAFNLIDLLTAGAFVVANQSTTFVTANTLQHRAYLLSWVAPHCWIAQHGVLRTTYDFPHPFNDVERIYLLTEDSAQDFEVYYSTNDYRVLNEVVSFEANPLSERAVLLGSSAPFIDQEIAFCRALRNASEVPLCIKLHPYNIYDERKRTLLDLADLVIDRDVHIACAVFVSVNSTYALHYERAGIATVCLESAGVTEVLAHLDALKVTRR